VTYIRSLLALQRRGDVRIAVATPATSVLYEILSESHYPDLYACDFPGKLHTELPSILRSIRRFRKIVAEFEPDIVHANGGPDLSIVLWSHPSGKYQVVRSHNAVKHLGDDPYHRYMYNRRVAQNIYVSAASMELSHSRGFVPPRARTIENGVDIARFQPGFPKESSIAARYQLADGTFVFGSCAGVGTYKRVDLAIKAAGRLRTSRPYAILVIGDEDGGRRLEEEARANGVTQFRYCGYQKDVRGFVSLSDVGFVLSDSIETLSYAAREMLAMGKPVISSSFAGSKENVVDGYNGFLTRPGNLDDVVTAMSRFLTMSADELVRFSANARAHAEQNFSLERQLQETLAVYEAALSSAEKASLVPWGRARAR
jgi:glycosyltransferase involved in cell wall biosynthesis